MAERTFALAAALLARSLNVRYEGIAIASRIPMMITTTRSSMSVKPDSSRARRLLIAAFTLGLLLGTVDSAVAHAAIGRDASGLDALVRVKERARSPAPFRSTSAAKLRTGCLCDVCRRAVLAERVGRRRRVLDAVRGRGQIGRASGRERV